MSSASKDTNGSHPSELQDDPVYENRRQGLFFMQAEPSAHAQSMVQSSMAEGPRSQQPLPSKLPLEEDERSKELLDAPYREESSSIEPPGSMRAEQVNHPYSNDSIGSQELDAFLDRVEHDQRYQVCEVLKHSSYEITQKVSAPHELALSVLGGSICQNAKKTRVSSPASKSASVASETKVQGEGQELFIRKYIQAESGLGRVYELLYRAQKAGQEFSYLPRIYECYHLRNQLVVIMEFIRGETLQEKVHRSGPSAQLAFKVFPELCAAVQELHEGFDPPIIHRDLKPTNIILSWDRLTLIDFGIARVYQSHLVSDTSHFGTREYAPPEQFGYGQTDVRSDIYALGMLLYFCLTGRTGNSEIRQNKFADACLPEPLRLVIEKATAFDPEGRYTSVAALQAAFMEAAKQSGILQAEDSPSMAEGSQNIPGEEPLTCEPESTRERIAKGANSSNQLKSDTAPAPSQEPMGQTRFRPASAAKQSSFLNSLQKVGAYFADKTPTWLGRLWNGLVLVMWALLLAACISLVFDPVTVLDKSEPLWFRVFEYGAFAGISITIIMYLLLDRRRLRKRLAWLRQFPIWKECVAGLAFLALWLVLFGIVYSVAI